MFMAISLVALLRLSGFASTVFGAKTPIALLLLYAGLAVAFGSGLLLIARGTIVEPPAWVVNGLGALQARLARPGART